MPAAAETTGHIAGAGEMVTAAVRTNFPPRRNRQVRLVAQRESRGRRATRESLPRSGVEQAFPPQKYVAEPPPTHFWKGAGIDVCLRRHAHEEVNLGGVELFQDATFPIEARLPIDLLPIDEAAHLVKQLHERIISSGQPRLLRWCAKIQS